MTKLFGFFMEIIRLILILLIGLFVLGYVEQYLFKLLGVTDVNWFFAFLADLIFIYIIYSTFAE
ncbi:MAG: hypothetical protein QJR05_10550 [Thermoanaerobacterium sp.]|nr:hypothetical protein [Thermoanaerobacterium sp.]